ncbi:MAG TPA: PEP-CTERM sorting domain-containing protein [Phycisphaerae bacterium]|jgi:hypothetical protein
MLAKKSAFLCALAAVVPFWMVSAASAVPLSTLLMPGGMLTSANGNVLFNNFVYMPTIGAPPPGAIDVSPNPNVPGGLVVQGPFQVSNGFAIDIIFGFDAHLNQGAFTNAEMTILNSNAQGVILGPGGMVLAQSSVVINEQITPLPGPGPETDLEVLDDVVGPDQFFASAPLNPAVYDGNIRVRKDMGLISVVANPPGPSVASISLFSQNFVPEPSSLLLMLAGTAVLLRRRSTR